MSDDGHPIEVDLERLLPLLAREIYTSPFAFLRENVQNAYDAVRMQRFRDQGLGITSEHAIRVTLVGNTLTVRDSGIGMSREDLARFFWSIGKSGKHTPEAKLAGVVGTFGIGGMANFGVCSKVEVTTRVLGSERSITSSAERAKLSAKKDCVFYIDGPAEFDPGTSVTGTLLKEIAVDEVSNYLEPIVRYLDVPVFVGETRLGGHPFPSVLREDGVSYTSSSGPLKVKLYVRALQNGQAELEVEEASWSGETLSISAVLSTTTSNVAAYQHGFMLSHVPVTSIFGLGGSINSSVLRPTAGREAVTDESRALVQHLLAAAETALATRISEGQNLPERFSAFYRYLCESGKWDLAGGATIRTVGSSSRVRLDSMRGEPKGKIYFARDGHDQAIIQAYSEQGKSVLILSTDPHRQRVEKQFLVGFCGGAPLEDRVTCLRIPDQITFAEEALKYQLHDRLRGQFLVDGFVVRAGELSHGAMLWVPPPQSPAAKTLYVDFRHPQIRRMVALREALSFDAVLDVFIRDSVLPHLESAFPELKKRDFDALLRKLQSTVEYFEIDPGDISRIQQLASITNMSPEDVATVFGGRRAGVSRQTSVQRSDVAGVPPRVSQAVEKVTGKSGDEMRQELDVLLLQTDIEAKILDATELSPQLSLARYYLALTRDAHLLYRRVFLERRPATDFSWGGHRVGYLFYGHGSAVVYYDIQFEHLIGHSKEHGRTGKLTLDHSPLVTRNQVFLPIPTMFEGEFVPTVTTLKFTVRHQILGVDRSEAVAALQ
jgi:molecular chaperone HtpG